MLAGLTWLLVFQCLGEVLVRLVGLPVPGPVVGMLLLFVALRVKGRAPAAIDGAATGLLQHLSLLFVPAGVGVMLHFGRLADEWAALVAALLLSTVAAIGVTAVAMQALLRRGERPGETVTAGRLPPGSGE
jgi:holin-like protein